LQAARYSIAIFTISVVGFHFFLALFLDSQLRARKMTVSDDRMFP
jgi:hypothetical protein